MEGCIRMSDACENMGGARGNLLSLLVEELELLLPSDAHEIVNERPGLTGLAYKEVFPRSKNILATQFRTRQELKEAICNSSMFPFFTSPWPCLIRPSSVDKNANEPNVDGAMISSVEKYLPRLIVDGYFTVPRERFGCPILDDYVTRTVTVSVFPHQSIGCVKESEICDRISPILKEQENPSYELNDMIRMAINPSSRQSLVALYERGISDAEKWSINYSQGKGIL